MHSHENNKFIREVDTRLMSYNVEMTEVTGGTFRKAYAPVRSQEPRSLP